MPTFATLLLNQAPLLYGTKCLEIFAKKEKKKKRRSHEELNITLASLHKQKSSQVLLEYIQRLILFQTTYCCIFPTHNLSSYCKGLKKLLPCTAREKVYKDEHSTVSCYFYSWYSEWWKILEGNGQQLKKHLLLPCTAGEDEVIIHKWLVDDISKSMPLQHLSTYRGLVSLIQRFHFRGLQFGNDKKVSTI